MKANRDGRPSRLAHTAVRGLALAALIAPAAAWAAPAGGAASRQRSVERREASELRRIHSEAERREQLARTRQSREEETGKKRTHYGYVTIGCTAEHAEPAITWHYENFPAEGLNVVTETIHIDGEALTPSTTFSFYGASAESTTPINDPELLEKGGKYRIDTMAQWNANGVRGGWDIPSSRTCGIQPKPAFTIRKLQRVEGQGSGFVTSPITTVVGQTVEYEIRVTNTGNALLTFFAVNDPRCDPGTLTGGNHTGMLEPAATEDFFCKHTITPADQTAGSYSNTASITGTPTGGPLIEERSDTVVAEVPPPGSNAGNGGNGGNGNNGNANNGNNGNASGTGASGSTGTPPEGPRQGSLAAAAVRAPLLSSAPQGCVRSGFLVRVNAKGVRSVVFYIDGHRVKALTARSARHGVFTLRVNVGRLKVGRHRLRALITMEVTAASRKRVSASRTLVFLRCASIASRPRFTG